MSEVLDEVSIVLLNGVLDALLNEILHAIGQQELTSIARWKGA